jgi:hypothetical protein
MAVWGVLFYYAIIDEVVDETDDTLENYAEILIEHVLHDSSLLETEGSLMSFYKFRPISEQEGNHYQEVFYDSTVYIELEDENEPVRVMRTAFRMPDGQFYELTLMISILERDDMVEAMLWYLGALFLLLLICTSRSFKFKDGDLSALRRSLSSLDTSGVVADLVGTDPAGAAFMMVV